MTTTILKRRLVPLLLSACFGMAVAAPTGQQVVAGQATFSQQGNVFSITNTPGTIINWQGFSINAGEVARFIQQSSDSAVLNRIVGQDPTRILGALQSNGKVFLINPNGILFGRDSRVDVNGLVASTLNMSNADFLAGKKNFTAGAVAGEVRNEGAIATPAGGQVFLVAPNVSNAGVITSPRGEVVLAAGHSVQLVDSRDPDMQVVVSAPADQAINLGQVVAQGGRVGIYGALVSQRGAVNADSAVVGENGRIVLKASRETVLEQGSVTSATGAGKGGDVHLLGQRVRLAGNAQVDASGALGGGSVLVGGDWQGKNAALPNARETIMDSDASIKADATADGDGGKVVLWSDASTRAFGSISAQGGRLGGNGGKIETSGHYLAVDGIRVDARAAKGKSGAWLLDPYDIEVKADGTALVEDVAISGAGSLTGTTKIAPSALTGAGADVVLQAQHDITVTDAITTSKSVTVVAGNDIKVNANVTSTGGDIQFNAGRAFNLGSGAAVRGDTHIDIIADQVTLGGTIGRATANSGLDVSFRPQDAAREIRIGGSSSGTVLWLDAGKLSAIPASRINVGTSLTTGGISIGGAVTQAGDFVLDSAGPIVINAPITVGSSSTFMATVYGTPLDVNAAISAGHVQLQGGDRMNINGSVTASGNVDIAADGALAIMKTVTAGSTATMSADGISGTGTVKAPTVDLRSTAGIGTAAAPLKTQTSRLLAYNEQMGNAPINISNTGELTITTAVQSAGEAISGNTGSITLGTTGSMTVAGHVESEGGDVSLIANKGMTVSGTVFAYGTVNLLADKGSNFTTVEGASVNTETGAIKVTAGSASIAKNTIPDSKLTLEIVKGPDPTPSLDQCLADPARASCGSVIDNARSACSANWNAGHCDDVMPKVDFCKINTGAPGCAAVIKHDALLQCVANPRSANCGDVLPKFDDCKGNSGALGCDAVVKQHDKVAACVSNPTAACYSDVLPTFDTCSKDPATFGCSPVVKRHDDISACVADPKAPGCSAVLPSPGSCHANPGDFGCAPVLAREKFESCVANAAGPGCDSVLPALDACKATPSAEGCGAVIRKTFDQCLINPNDARCTGVLPKVSECVNDKTRPGCQVVLPTMLQCIGSPTLQGCGVILPKLEQCAANPNLQGCEAVLPKPDFCGTHPQDPTCQVFNPGSNGKGNEAKGGEVVQAVQTSVTLINGSTGKTGGAGGNGANGGLGNPDGAGTNSGASGSDSNSEKPAEKVTGPAAGENSGAKNEKPATKTYCN